MAYSFADFADPVINFFSNMDSSTKVLGSIFIILFIILSIAFSKTFKEKPSTGKVLAFVISFVVIYLLNMTNISYGYAFDYLGYDTGIASTIITWIIIAGIIITFFMVGLDKILLILGAISLITGIVGIYTDIVYQKTFFIILGIIFLIIGFFLWRRKKEKERLRQLGQFPQKKSPILTLIKIALPFLAIWLWFLNPIISLFLFLIWILILFFTRKKKPKYPQMNGPWSRYKNKYRDYKRAKQIRKAGMETPADARRRIARQEDEQKQLKKEAKEKMAKTPKLEIEKENKKEKADTQRKAEDEAAEKKKEEEIKKKQKKAQKKEKERIEKGNLKQAKENLRIRKAEEKSKAESERKQADLEDKLKKEKKEKDRIAYEAKLREQKEQNINRLTLEARNFKELASKQKNPVFYGSWEMFVNYLKKRGYGSSESDICKRLEIDKKDFVKIFNKYGKIKGKSTKGWLGNKINNFQNKKQLNQINKLQEEIRNTIIKINNIESNNGPTPKSRKLRRKVSELQKEFKDLNK